MHFLPEDSHTGKDPGVMVYSQRGHLELHSLILHDEKLVEGLLTDAQVSSGREVTYSC